MPNLILAVLLIAGLYGLITLARKASPQVLARLVKTGGGVAALAAAAFVGIRGQIAVAIPLALSGLGLLGWNPGQGFTWAPGFGWPGTQRSSGQSSRVRSPFVEMTLDHDSGRVAGRFIDGPYAGRSLDEFDLATLKAALVNVDENSAQLLAAYMDSRFAGWRDDAERDAANGRAGSAGGKMTEEEAYEILGLHPGAGRDDITRAHRTMMKKVHPDQGGSTYLAARVNEAKDLLLKRHHA